MPDHTTLSRRGRPNPPAVTHAAPRRDAGGSSRAPTTLLPRRGSIATSADNQAWPNGLAASHGIRQAQPPRGHHRPAQAPDRTQVPGSHAARSARRGRHRCRSARPHDPNRRPSAGPERHDPVKWLNYRPVHATTLLQDRPVEGSLEDRFPSARRPHPRAARRLTSGMEPRRLA